MEGVGVSIGRLRRGMRQCCLLSLLLFALFLNDVNTFLVNEMSGITGIFKCVLCLLQADDAMLLADSEDELPPQLNALGI